MSTIVGYLDAKHNLADKGEAKWEITHKYDKEGELIEEVWVDLKKNEGKR